MSVDKALRAMIRTELETQLGPLRAAVAQLQSGTADFAMLRTAVQHLLPVASFLSPFFGGAEALPQSASKRNGSRGALLLPARTKGAPGHKASGSGKRGCALMGCKAPSRTKGYCGAHYQKLRMLARGNRRPEAWVDYAQPGSVMDIKLPRGRAASKALKAMKSLPSA